MVFPVLVMTGLGDAGRELLSDKSMTASASLYLSNQQKIAERIALRADGGMDTNALVELPLGLTDVGQDVGVLPGHYYSSQAIWLIDQLADMYPQMVFLVCYQAPWVAFSQMATIEKPAEVLPTWLRCHQHLLQLRLRLQKRLLLLNADHVGDDLAKLNIYLQQEYAIDISEMLQDNLPLPPGPTEQTVWFSRAKTMEAVAPEYWDIYEALESCALLFGREPEFRHQLTLPPDCSLQALVTEWDKSRQVAALHEHLMDSERRQELFETQMAEYVESTHEVALKLELQTGLNGELQSLLESVTGQHSALQLEHTTLMKQFNDLHQRYTTVQQRVESTQAEADATLNCLQATQEELLEHHVERQAFHEHIDGQHSVLAALLADLAPLATRLRECSGLPRIEHQKESPYNAEHAIDRMAQTIRKLALEIRDMSTTADYLITQKSALQISLQEAGENNASLLQLVDGLRVSSVRARQMITRLMAQHSG